MAEMTASRSARMMQAASVISREDMKKVVVVLSFGMAECGDDDV